MIDRYEMIPYFGTLSFRLLLATAVEQSFLTPTATHEVSHHGCCAAHMIKISALSIEISSFRQHYQDLGKHQTIKYANCLPNEPVCPLTNLRHFSELTLDHAYR